MRTQGTYYIRGTEGRKDGRTEGRKDGRTEGRNAENYVPPLFFEKAGDNKSNRIATVGFRDYVPVWSGHLQGRDGGLYYGIDDIRDRGQSNKGTVQPQFVFRITYLSEVVNYRDVVEAHTAD